MMRHDIFYNVETEYGDVVINKLFENDSKAVFNVRYNDAVIGVISLTRGSKQVRVSPRRWPDIGTDGYVPMPNLDEAIIYLKLKRGARAS